MIQSSKQLNVAVLILSVGSIVAWCELPLNITVLWWSLNAYILYAIYKIRSNGYRIPIIKVFLIWSLIMAVYGACFLTESYWDWKLLVSNIMVFLLPMSAEAFNNEKIVSSLLHYWYKHAWKLLIILSPFLYSDAFGNFLAPYTLLALFLPLLNRKMLLWTLAAFVITLMFGVDSRSSIIRFCFCMLLGLVCYIDGIRLAFRRIYSLLYVSLFTFPIILFSLGVLGIFNVFQLDEEFDLKGKYSYTSADSGEERSMLTDTRTGLYVWVINSAIEHNYIVTGHSPARGYESPMISSSENANKLAQSGVRISERGSSEVAIHNIFTYYGLIGVVLYFLIFLLAAYKAIWQSQNSFIPIVGIYVSFRWMYAWIEDFSNIDLNYLLLWIIIGMCYSPRFRNMTDNDFKNWFKTINL